MLGVLISGANGKMGKAVAGIISERDDAAVVAGVDKYGDSEAGFPVFSAFSDVVVKCDVIIDFSSPDALDDLLEFSVNGGIPVVLCTTGYNEEDMKKIETASHSVPVFFSYNMSMGVSLLTELAAKAAAALGDDFDIEIVEKHHNRKVDAPSGTALKLADAINEARGDKLSYEYDRHSRREKRPHNEIGISSVRGGTIVGEHEIIFAGNDEVITLTHTAYSRKIFAVGALRAAKYITTMPAGLYSMKDMI